MPVIDDVSSLRGPTHAETWPPNVRDGKCFCIRGKPSGGTYMAVAFTPKSDHKPRESPASAGLDQAACDRMVAGEETGVRVRDTGLAFVPFIQDIVHAPILALGHFWVHSRH